MTDQRQYDMASSMRGQLLSEANIFEALGSKITIIKHAGDDPENGYVRNVDSLFPNGAYPEINRPEKILDTKDYYTAEVEPANEILKLKIMAFAGAQIPAEPRIMTDAERRRRILEQDLPLNPSR